VLQTVPRTINTGLGAMAILAALVVLGGDSLADFALALLIGLVVGTVSSVFTATPLFLELSARWPASGQPRRRRPSGSSGSSGSSGGSSRGAGRRTDAAVEAATSGRDRWASADPYADVPPGR
jgi:SecD/SecF fusion protein